MSDPAIPSTNPEPIVYPQTKPDSVILPYGVPHLEFAQHWVRIKSYDEATDLMTVEIRTERTQAGVQQQVKVGDAVTINQQQYTVLALQAPQNGLGWLEIDSHPQP
ncbi:hypothetical protein [Herpetosiphon geysericola]|uniref:Uncharacterized protein n=1 Tax=Herpetosiphon geysericola TaxID=70996 RepID=A0A0P6XJE2_9CHLR|nr:hypothetical protein [Herpetosiphon geysericola]KPL83665.1 hypothetical protein SE18_18985 [Herpetosiphon geysericola]